MTLMGHGSCGSWVNCVMTHFHIWGGSCCWRPTTLQKCRAERKSYTATIGQTSRSTERISSNLLIRFSMFHTYASLLLLILVNDKITSSMLICVCVICFLLLPPILIDSWINWIRPKHSFAFLPFHRSPGSSQFRRRVIWQVQSRWFLSDESCVLQQTELFYILIPQTVFIWYRVLQNEVTLHFREYLENYQRYNFCTHQGQCIINMSTMCDFAHFIT